MRLKILFLITIGIFTTFVAGCGGGGGGGGNPGGSISTTGTLKISVTTPPTATTSFVKATISGTASTTPIVQNLTINPATHTTLKEFVVPAGNYTVKIEAPDNSLKTFQQTYKVNVNTTTQTDIRLELATSPPEQKGTLKLVVSIPENANNSSIRSTITGPGISTPIQETLAIDPITHSATSSISLSAGSYTVKIESLDNSLKTFQQTYQISVGLITQADIHLELTAPPPEKKGTLKLVVNIPEDPSISSIRSTITGQGITPIQETLAIDPITRSTSSITSLSLGSYTVKIEALDNNLNVAQTQDKSFVITADTTSEINITVILPSPTIQGIAMLGPKANAQVAITTLDIDGLYHVVTSNKITRPPGAGVIESPFTLTILKSADPSVGHHLITFDDTDSNGEFKQSEFIGEYTYFLFFKDDKWKVISRFEEIIFGDATLCTGDQIKIDLEYL